MKIKLLIVTLFTLLVFSSVSVMAAESPTAADYHTVTIGGKTVGANSSSTTKVKGGKITVSQGSVKDGKKVTITATTNKGMTFSKWKITGDYTIVSGSIKDSTIVIIPNGDIDISAVFVDDEGNVVEEPTKIPSVTPNKPDTSPQTGVPFVPVAIIFTLSLAIGVVSIKSIIE